MKKHTLEDKLVISKCQELVKGYFDIFDIIATDIVSEISGTILANTMEGISLEYLRREGMKQGIKEFLRRIHTKAATQHDK